MKCVHVFNSGVVSGPETAVIPQLKALDADLVMLVETRLGEKGRGPAAWARNFGLSVREVEVRGRLDFRAIRELRRCLQGYNVAHAHDVKASTYTWLAKPPSRIKLVSTHHGILGRPDFKTRFYEWFYSKFVLPRFDAVVAVSREDYDILCHRGIDQNRLVFITNGITLPEVPEQQRAEIRTRLVPDAKPGELLFAMVARISPEKRHDKMLRFAQALQLEAGSRPWRILCYGTGPREPQFRSETAMLGLGAHVEWKGFNTTIGRDLAAFDGVLLFSDAEALPIVALEAGWSGTPVFAPSVGGLVELVDRKDSPGGLLFYRTSPVTEIAQSMLATGPGPRWRTWGKNLQARVKAEYSAEKWLEQVKALYRSITGI